MILELFYMMVEFLEANAILIALLMAVVEYVKLGIQQYDWYQGWMGTLLAFVLGFLFAIPPAGFDLVPFIVHGIGLGLVATGVYKVGEGLFRKQ